MSQDTINKDTINANNTSENETFSSVKTRLDEIVHEVSDESLSLDEALALYEEAVALGLRASDLLEEQLDDAPDESSETLSVDGSQEASESVTSPEFESALEPGSSEAAQPESATANA